MSVNGPVILETITRFIEHDCQSCHHMMIAYSGGIDSHVLLHTLASLRNQYPNMNLQAIHVNHNVNPLAKKWAEHCQAVCDALAVPLISRSLNLTIPSGGSVEAVLREGRYQIFAEYMTAETCLLTAHHQDDQAETVLLQLLRGAGPKGLAAMPALQTFRAGYLGRPLLTITRQQLQTYADAYSLSWVEDDSNQDIKWGRNYLRQQVMPVLKQRWPSLANCLSRSARHLAQSQSLLEELAADDLSTLITSETALNCRQLLTLSSARQSNVIRYWLHTKQAKMPNETRLLSFLHSLANSAQDKLPQLAWDGNVLLRNGHYLYLLTADKLVNMNHRIPWPNLSIPLTLPNDLGDIIAVLDSKGGINPDINTKSVCIRFRQGGERIQPQGHRCHQSLKKLMQVWRIPVWQRAHIPLLYCENELVSVIGYCVAEPFAVQDQLGFKMVHKK